ncbi:ABC transporter ATP-binding protein [Bradyrhizobium sp. LHD-71]|uniref:ABC transporter ATP-binding protein n=1 Tax=Bradyrhizobium sp. LHD-71 TaxID=3072141 RepID=UPI00280F8B1E|nr:ABC transporter ATP-binding protein [Bradyrhizobium sp. LHD-71]MDQ8729131.1 ABC transporter ATP-binding protein [Bradyrhizobium sp. LHD-71]
MTALLDVRNLSIGYRTSRGEAKAVDGISFTIEPGEYLGLVGESGCGKSTIAKALLGILPEGARVSGTVKFKNTSLVNLSQADFRKIRWTGISLVPQSAMNGFDPVYTIGQQIREAIESHRQLPAAERDRRVEELFALVGLSKVRLKDYPHQFSGGMRQRAMIAMSMVLDPALIVADEPTTGLDVIVQDQIMRRMKEIHERLRKSMLLITHDMAVVAENCDKIAVMYAGRIMEYGDERVFREPHHPYTMGLCAAFPEFDDRRRELISIPGAPPDLLNPPTGCRFHQRCPFATAQCAVETPPEVEISPGHVAACHFVDRAGEFRKRSINPETWRPPQLA